ncbi:MAG: undecaprenyldiphospho-muramoylpentapeptide beta-N-acetylglucosaminyltransferase [Candidatus Lambdaproteobacteria bacterium]|nr:undecaprenyldiphospho-muramoylpentapeptide beta-N-acetylglucosaminyltransferase [Candidatus Lambdaproteobacteria bacterium]
MNAPAAPRLRILIAGGGTGGHLYPGLAIAEAFRRRVANVEVRFVGSTYGIEARVVPARGYRLHTIPVRGLYQVSLWRKAWVLAMLPAAFLECVALLLRFRPHAVIGVGGYASGPLLATAILLRRLTFIQEQNAYPGLTNRLLGRFVRLAFVPVSGLDALFPRQVLAGNPVRADILALRDRPPPVRALPVLFVLGGSQGARRINEAVVAALPRLKGWGRPLRILHQTGALDLDWVRRAYREQGFREGRLADATQPGAAEAPAQALPQVEVVPFIDDIAHAYAHSWLIVSRAGASAVTEIVTARRPAILIPIPGTSGEHQLRNAQRVAQAGAGLVIEQHQLDGERLAGHVLALLDDPARLARMEAACDGLFRGDAAAQIVDTVLGLLPSPLSGSGSV